jgi:hypothetical protein
MGFNAVKVAVVSIALSAVMLMDGPCAGETDQAGSGASQVVKGSVLDQDGEYYVIKDMSGHEMRLHVNQDTQMTDRIKVGDRIEAQVTSDGHAKSIRVPDAMSPTPNAGAGAGAPGAGMGTLP